VQAVAGKGNTPYVQAYYIGARVLIILVKLLQNGRHGGAQDERLRAAYRRGERVKARDWGSSDADVTSACGGADRTETEGEVMGPLRNPQTRGEDQDRKGRRNEKVRGPGGEAIWMPSQTHLNQHRGIKKNEGGVQSRRQLC